jgi:hypothetical protein
MYVQDTVGFCQSRLGTASHVPTDVAHAATAV